MWSYLKYFISNVTAWVDLEQLGQVRGCRSLSGVKWETGLLGMALVSGQFGLQTDWTVPQAVIPPAELFGSFTLVFMLHSDEQRAICPYVHMQ